jgi:hypothetical protein
MKTRSGSIASSIAPNLTSRPGYTPISETPIPIPEAAAVNGWSGSPSSQPNTVEHIPENRSAGKSDAGWEEAPAGTNRNLGWEGSVESVQQPMRAESPFRAQTPRPAPTAAHPVASDDDGWESYTPTKSAADEGEAAYQRRIQMSSGRAPTYGSIQDHYVRQQPPSTYSPIQRPDSRASMQSRVYSRSGSPPPSHKSRSKGEISIKGIASRARKSHEASSAAVPGTPTKSTTNNVPIITIPAQITEVVIDWKTIETITGKMGGLSLDAETLTQETRAPDSFSYSAMRSPNIIREPRLPAANGHLDEANFASRRKAPPSPPAPPKTYIGWE